VSLKQRLDNDIKAALLGGNRFESDVLRNFKAVILNEEVSLGKREEGLDDQSIEQLIARELKKRNDSAQQYDAAGRPELAENERNESKVLEVYLPEQLSEDDIKKAVDTAVSTLGVTSMAGMGQVIGAVKKELGNAADGSVIARIVKETLS